METEEVTIIDMTLALFIFWAFIALCVFFSAMLAMFTLMIWAANKYYKEHEL